MSRLNLQLHIFSKHKYNVWGVSDIRWNIWHHSGAQHTETGWTCWLDLSQLSFQVCTHILRIILNGIKQHLVFCTSKGWSFCPGGMSPAGAAVSMFSHRKESTLSHTELDTVYWSLWVSKPQACRWNLPRTQTKALSGQVMVKTFNHPELF